MRIHKARPKFGNFPSNDIKKSVTLVLFTGLPWLQLLITCSRQNLEPTKAWEYFNSKFLQIETAYHSPHLNYCQ